jgi:hypothetical protein
MHTLLNWSIIYLVVLVVMISVLFAAAPGFVRVNKGETNESVSVWKVTLWSLLFTAIIVGGSWTTMYFMNHKKSSKMGFGCGCNGVAWGIGPGSPDIELPSSFAFGEE